MGDNGGWYEDMGYRWWWHGRYGIKTYEVWGDDITMGNITREIWENDIGDMGGWHRIYELMTWDILEEGLGYMGE